MKRQKKKWNQVWTQWWNENYTFMIKKRVKRANENEKEKKTKNIHIYINLYICCMDDSLNLQLHWKYCIHKQTKKQEKKNETKKMVMKQNTKKLRQL